MYVCLCHAITEKDVQEAQAQGAASALEIFAHFGVAPQCGKCVSSMGELVGGGAAVGSACCQNAEMCRKAKAACSSPQE